MDFRLNEEQQLLTDSIARLLRRRHDFQARQAIIASPSGSDSALWHELAAIGLLSVPFAEDDGGYGGGALDLLAPLAACGESLLLEPVLSTLAPAGRLIATLGSPVQRARWLPHLIDGSLRLAFAHDEEPFDETPGTVTSRALRSGDGWRLSGDKQMVIHAPLADRFVVTAQLGQAGDGDARMGVFVVDPRARGVTCRSFRTIDDLRAGDVRFREVDLPADALLQPGTDPTDAAAAIAEAIDFATALTCAEAIGVMDLANRATLEYVKTRRQFGVPIGSFQALQHRLVEMTIQATQARSITLLACARVDAAARGRIDPAERVRVVSAAKALVATACRHIGQEAIQLHGGIGMTLESAIAHAFKRLTVLARQYGDADFHLGRHADVSDRSGGASSAADSSVRVAGDASGAVPASV